MRNYILLFIFTISLCSNGNAGAQQKKAKPAKQKQKNEVAGPNDPEMVYLEGGTFTMGNNEKSYNERPAHKVTLKSFSIGKYEVTIAEFRKFIDATHYRTSAEAQGWSYVFDGTNTLNQAGVKWNCDAFGFPRKPNEDNQPVIYVSYNDAVQYCKWLSGITKKNYHLPTEAEWEYAAKGGNKYGKCNFSGSNDINEVGWYKANSTGETHPVGQKQANEIGLYDMTGNVSEWCADWFGEKYYGQNVSDNPQGPATGISKVLRGGSWFQDPGFSRTSSRFGYDPNFSCDYAGFRVAKD